MNWQAGTSAIRAQHTPPIQIRPPARIAASAPFTGRRECKGHAVRLFLLDTDSEAFLSIGYVRSSGMPAAAQQAICAQDGPDVLPSRVLFGITAGCHTRIAPARAPANKPSTSVGAQRPASAVTESQRDG
jgi:hypothetical protein